MQNKITVLHFTSIINKYDFIDTILKFSDPNKFRMLACTLTDESNIEDPELQKAGIPYYNLGLGHNSKQYPKIIKKLVQILKVEKVDVIHTHHYHEALMGTLAAKLAGNVKIVIGRHYHEEFYLTTKGLKLKLYLGVESFVNNNASTIISPSTLITDLLQKQGVSKYKISQVTYGFDFSSPKYRKYTDDEIYKVRKELRLNDEFVIGNFGRHHPIKGQKYLIDAFAAFIKLFPNSVLVMVGDGPIHEELKQYVIDLDVTNNVIFLGWRKDGQQLMAAMDVIVHPTLQEAFPQTMIEIMSLAKPMIICPVSGATDQVIHRATGYLVPFKNSDAILEGLVWYKNNPEKAKRIGQAAHKYVLENLDIKKVVHDYEDVYIKVMK